MMPIHELQNICKVLNICHRGRSPVRCRFRGKWKGLHVYPLTLLDHAYPLPAPATGKKPNLR